MTMPRNDQSSAERAAAALQRDATLARIARARRWMLAGAAALTAALAGLASALLPGKSLGAKTHVAAVPAKTASSSSSTPTLPPPAGAAALGLQGGGDESDPSQPAAPTRSEFRLGRLQFAVRAGPARPGSRPAPPPRPLPRVAAAVVAAPCRAAPKLPPGES